MFPKYTPLCLGPHVFPAVYALPSTPWDVILSTAGTFQTEQSHEAFTWSLQPTLVYFPLKSLFLLLFFPNLSSDITCCPQDSTFLMLSPTSLQAFWRQESYFIYLYFLYRSFAYTQISVFVYVYICVFIIPSSCSKSKICSHSINIGGNN